MEDTSDIGCEGKLCAIASDTSVVVVSIFRAMVTYTLRELELCISTLPALHAVGNLYEVAECAGQERVGRARFNLYKIVIVSKMWRYAQF